MATTTVVVAGMLVTVAVKAVTSISTIIARSANAWTHRKRKSVQRTKNAESPHMWEMVAVTMKTIIAAAIGTMVIAAGRTLTNSSTRTARHANAWIPRKQQVPKNAKDTAQLHSTKVTATATTTTITAVVDTMVATVVARLAKGKINLHIAKIVNAWTQLKLASR